MKILVINWRDMKNPEAGGAEVHIDEILKRKPDGYEVDFVSAAYKGSIPEETMNGYRVIRIGNNQLFNFQFRSFWNKTLKHNNYDLVVDDVSKIPLATPKYIKTAPIIAIQHHIHGKTLFTQLPYPMAFYVYNMERYYLRYYTGVPLLSVSESNRDELMHLYPFKNIIVLHNGINTGPIEAVSEVTKTIEPTMVSVGRLKRYKRVDHLFQALAIIRKSVPNARLIVLGKGDDEERLKSLVREMNLTDAVDFKGFVADEEKIQLIKQSWVFGITSEKEGWGIVVIESNACGLPAVGYNVEGLRDSIRDGENGFLTPDSDIDAFSKKVVNLMTDKSLYAKMREKSLQWAKTFSWDNTAREFYRIAEETVAGWNGGKRS